LIVAFYVPVVAYTFLRLTGSEFGFRGEGVAAFYEWISGGWIWLELAAILAAGALYAWFRAPLLALPLCLFVLFLAEDATARAVGLDQDSSTQWIGAFVLAFATLAVVTGIWLDYRGLRRHAFWPHLFGAIEATVGLALLLGPHSYQLALIAAGAALLFSGVWLGRVLHLAAGGLTLWVGITCLEPSPIILTLSGLGLLAVSVWLSLANSPFRRWLQLRALPAPQRD
jgi:hypothetical protein